MQNSSKLIEYDHPPDAPDFQSAYKMDTNEAKFIVGTVSNCRIIDSNNVIAYSPQRLKAPIYSEENEGYKLQS